MTSVGSSAPRLGSISRREKVESTAGAPSRSASAPRQRRRADVVGDVPLERPARQAERPIARRQGVRGVVADRAARPRRAARRSSRRGKRLSLSASGAMGCVRVHGRCLLVGMRRDYGRQARFGRPCPPPADGNLLADEAQYPPRPAAASSPPSRRSSSARWRWACPRSSSGSPMSARSPAPSGGSRSRCRCSTPGCGSRNGRDAAGAAVLEAGDPLGPRLRRRSLLLASGDRPHQRRQRDLLRHQRADLGGAVRLAAVPRAGVGERAVRARPLPRGRRGAARPELPAEAGRRVGDLFGLATGVFFGLYFLAVQAARKTISAARLTFEAGRGDGGDPVRCRAGRRTADAAADARWPGRAPRHGLDQPCRRPGPAHRSPSAGCRRLSPRW